MAKTKECRFTVGIDLGTTNTVISYVDHLEENPLPRTLSIPQTAAPGEIQSLDYLPSFIYIPLQGELGKGLFTLPWQNEEPDMVTGIYACAKSAESPGRVVSSAKSWLCSQRIDRHSACLPAAALPEDNAIKISPVKAAEIILKYLRDAWNFTMAAEDKSLTLENQTVVITVPASFDAAARELTVEAAEAAGLKFTLLEEPQAAFYSWLAEHDKDWRDFVAAGDVILVCDIGGGTTDFSLIEVTSSDGDLQLQRLAVGNHTLLGGDNMDITLAMSTAAKLAQQKKINLSQYQLTALTHACRRAKEALGNGADAPQPLTILGRGSSLLGGTITTSISGDELKAALLEGFFPFCSLEDIPAEDKRRGLRTFALDYAADPAFTKHLAAFLNTHCKRDEDGAPVLPGLVLFNGGVTKAPVFRQRILQVLETWRPDSAPAAVLEQNDPDLAVARGAAWLAHTDRSGGIRIKAGSARSYYIGIESPMPAIPGFPRQPDALCVVNHGMEEGTELRLNEKQLALVVGEATDFSLFTSTTRTEDKPGDRLTDWNESELTEMPVMTVTLNTESPDENGSLVPVTLRTVLTDIGTLQLWCDETDGDRHWKLEFELRSTETDLN